MSWNKWWSRAPESRIRPELGRGPWSRRAILGGGAAAITLPFLESLRQPAYASAANGTCPVRLIFYFAPCGIVMEDFTPDALGAGYDLPRILQPLASLQSEVSVHSGLANMSALVVGAGGDHARGTGSFLSCVTVEKTVGDDIRNGITIDQVVANEVGNQTPFGSLEIGCAGGASVGTCDLGYSCAYTRNISWASDTVPMPKTIDPKVLFDRIFDGFDPHLSMADRERRKRWRGSVLDSVAKEAGVLQGRLSHSDKAKLDEFLTGVRELEQRIQLPVDNQCAPGDAPQFGAPYEDRVAHFNQVLVTALECDLTRVATFMLENGSSERNFDFLGTTGGHHETSHHLSDPNKIETLVTIDTWEVAMYADLLERMRSVTEADGSTLLDNSLVLFSSEVSDGDRHNHDDLPVLLAGRGGGHAAGNHVVHPWQTPVANLYLAMGQAAGATATSHGDSTGILPLV